MKKQVLRTICLRCIKFIGFLKEETIASIEAIRGLLIKLMQLGTQGKRWGGGSSEMSKKLVSGALILSLTLIAWELQAQLHFQDVAAQKGIEHRYLSVRLGGGVSCYDFNQDGLDDITLATAFGDPIDFYLNMGGHFQLLPPLVDNQDEAKQILWVDFDNDGDLDLFVATYDGLNRLYEQTGNLTFTDITLAAGLPSFNTRTYGACFGDFDRDGWLDLYFGDRIAFQPQDNRHYLFRNNGDKTFSDVSYPAAAQDTSGLQFCSGFIDYNLDGWPDIYTAHDRIANLNTLLENQADGTFADVGAAARADLAIEAMSVTSGDYDRDGLLDIYCTNIPEGNKLLHNDGPDSTNQYVFSEVAAESGVGFYGMSWGAVFLDADNDADLDLYVSGSVAGADVRSAAFFQNESDGTFSEPSAGFLGDTVVSYNNAVGDFNADGYPDIMVINIYPFFSHLWASPALENNWIKLDLEGVLSNRDAIGTRVECWANGQYQQHYTRCGNGFMGQDTRTVSFGLGEATLVDSIVVHWPSGHIDQHYNLNTNTRLALREGGSTDGNILPDPQTGLEPLIITSTDVAPEATTLRAYPSPTEDWLFVESTSEEITAYAIYNSQGQVVRQVASGFAKQFKIDVRSLPSGTYYLSLIDAKQKNQVLSWIKS